MTAIDWQAIFVPAHSLLELALRTSLMYLALILLMRFALSRQAGEIGTTDVLVIVLLAQAAGRASSPDHISVPEGITIIGTILAWSYLLEWAGYRFPLIERILRAPVVVLIENGRMNRRNMRAEFITPEELKAQLREKGIEDFSEVKRACMEADGSISVVKNPR